MERLARFLPFRAFGRLRDQRVPRTCAYTGRSTLPVARKPDMLTAEDGAPVRVYRTSSRVILVGSIDAVCAMIDRCIAEENAGLRGGLFDRAA